MQNDAPDAFTIDAQEELEDPVIPTLPMQEVAQRKSSSSQHVRALSLDSGSSSEDSEEAAHPTGHQRSISDMSVSTLKNKLHRTVKKKFVPGLVRRGSLSQEKASDVCTGFENSVELVLSELQTSDQKSFLRDRLHFFAHKKRAIAAIQSTEDIRKNYYCGAENTNGLLAAIEGKSPEELREIFLIFQQEVKGRPLTDYLEKRLPIIKRLLEQGVSAGEIVPCFGNNNVLQTLFKNPQVTENLDMITNKQVRRVLLELIEVLIENGLVITHENSERQNLLHIISAAKDTMQSYLITVGTHLPRLNDDSDKPASPHDLVESIFKSVMAMIHATIKKNQSIWQNIHEATGRMLPAPIAQTVCDYLRLFDRKTELKCLENSQNLSML